MRLPFLAVLLACAPLAATASDLPNHLAPAEPFPQVLQQAPTLETVAPGVEYGDYQLLTSVGPLSIHVVAVAPGRSDVHVESILADDELTSPGETVGSMAKRTGAVAGINGDYFDVGNTNRPTNIVVRDGVLLRMPRKRYAIVISRDGKATLTELGFLGEVAIGDRTVALDGVDELPPPNGGTSLITPVFGEVPPLENTTLVALQWLDGAPPLARYRVTGIADNLSAQPAGYYVAIGPASYNLVDVPNVGDLVSATGDLSPVGLGDIAAAIGGGPLILHEGTWYDDPDGPNGGEYDKAIPCSGLALAPDGTLFLIEVDGREPLLSVGINRHQLAALMRDLGADEGMALDGGGSSTIVVRRLGDAVATVQNAPSDGIERPVGDGLFVFSTAPTGPAARLVARPGAITALSGAEVPLRLSAVDAANHVAAFGEPIAASVIPATLGNVGDGTFTALEPGTGRVVMRSGNLKGWIGVEVERNPARIAISPLEPNVERGGSVRLEARAYDARGYLLASPALLPWSASSGSIDASGEFRAGDKAAEITLRIGDATATTRVTVGSHEVAIPFAERARFTTVPHGGDGSVARDPACTSCVQLAYAFSAGERAAYANAELPLPHGTIGLSFDVLDDGSDARLRVAVRNTIEEDLFVDATALDDPGWRRIVVRFPPQVAQPAKLIAIYVLPPKGMQESSGQIELRNVRAVVSGQ